MCIICPPALGYSTDEAEADLAEALDSCEAERFGLCESLAHAVVLREPLPQDRAAQLAGALVPSGSGCRISALSVALAGDERAAAGWLVHLPVMVGQRVTAQAAADQAAADGWEGDGEAPGLAPAGALGPGSAAFLCATSGRTLAWRESSSSPTPPHDDWQALFRASSPAAAAAPAPAPANPAQAARRPQAVVTVPLLPQPDTAAAASTPLGAASFVLEGEPSEGDVASLQELGACLARSIQHQTKALWEESLGFLTQVIPPRVVQRMLSAALSMGPLVAATAPHPPAAAAAGAAAAVAGAAWGAAEPSTPTPLAGASAIRLFVGPRGSMRLGTCNPAAAPASLTVKRSPSGSEGNDKHSPSSSESGDSEAGEPPTLGAPLRSCERHVSSGATACIPASSKVKGAGAAAESAQVAEEQGHPEAPAGASEARDPGLGVKTLRQKWNLEFEDPVLEQSFKAWFNTLQTKTDLAVFRHFSVLLLLLVAALVVRGGTTLGDLLAVTHGLLSVAALGAVMLLNTGWYIAHRSMVVACVRICSAGLLLVHVYSDPEFYSGGLLKGLAASCALTLIINSFRNRLRFSNHLLVQLCKLYLCSMANAFTFADPARAARTYLSLPETTLVQLSCALLPSMIVYRLEAGMRRKFLAAGVEAGILQLPASPSPTSSPSPTVGKRAAGSKTAS